MSARVRVTFQGFAKKYDEWIEVGAGRLRPIDLGPPSKEGFEAEFYVVDYVTAQRLRRRREYLVKWEGYDEPTWEPRSSFVGAEAKRKLDNFLEANPEPDATACDDASTSEGRKDARRSVGSDGICFT